MLPSTQWLTGNLYGAPDVGSEYNIMDFSPSEETTDLVQKYLEHANKIVDWNIGVAPNLGLSLEQKFQLGPLKFEGKAVLLDMNLHANSDNVGFETTALGAEGSLSVGSNDKFNVKGKFYIVTTYY